MKIRTDLVPTEASDSTDVYTPQSPYEAFSAWADGRLGRRITVELTEEEAALLDVGGLPPVNQLNELLAEAIRQVYSLLSLPANVFQQGPVDADPKIFPSGFWSTAIAHNQNWTTPVYAQTFSEMAVHTAKQLAHRDTAVALFTMEQAATSTDDHTIQCARLTPTAISYLRDQIQRWALNDLVLCGTPGAWAKVCAEAEPGFLQTKEQGDPVQMILNTGHYMRIPMFVVEPVTGIADDLWCLDRTAGYRVPQIPIYGTHSIHRRDPIAMESLPVSVEARHYQSMAIVNSRGVAVARTAD